MAALALGLAGTTLAGEADDRLGELSALVKAGKYAEAESGARALLPRVEAERGPGSVEAAGVLDVFVESLLRGGKARVAEARDLAERAVSIKERTLGTDHPDVARSLNNLAGLLSSMGDFAAARALYERSLKTSEKALGPDHPDVAGSLNGLATLLRSMGDYAAARPLAERALAIREKTLGSDHPDVAASLNTLAILLWSEGDYAAARPLYERALAIRETAFGPDHPEVAGSLGNLANLLRDMGDYAASRRLQERALAIRERAFGPDHPEVAVSLNSLGILLWDTGDYPGARTRYERALAISEKALGPTHPNVAKTLNNLANLLKDSCDYVGARTLYVRALAIWEGALGPTHPDVATGLNNLAELLDRTGDFAEARPLQERALELREKALGPDHPDVAMSLNNLAHLHFATGDRAGARTLYERTLAIWEKTLGPDHPEVGMSLNNLASLLSAEGEYAAARPLYERTLAIWEKALGPDHPAVSMGLLNLATLLGDTGSHDEARALCERSLAIRERALGPDHPLVAEDQYLLAHLHATAGEVAAALDAALEVERIAREHVRLTGRSLPEREALRYAAVRDSGLDLALTLAGRGLDGASRRRVLDAVVRSRAVVFDEMAARHRAIGGSSDPEVARLAEDVARARSRLSNLVVRGPSDQEPGVHRELLDEARKEKEQAERALAGASASFAREFSRGRLGVDDVAASLPQGSALVAMTRYNKLALAQEMVGKTEGVPSYVAFALRSGETSPEVVDLGSAREIDDLVARWRKEVAGGSLRADRGLMEAEAAYREAGTALRKRVWDPLRAIIKDSPRVFLVLDGSLNLVNIAALPVDEGGYLVERGPMVHYFSTERDLVPAGEARQGEGILAIGSPAYDATPLDAGPVSNREKARPTGAEVASRRSFRGERSGCGDFKSVRFDPLPASEREANEIAGLWKKKGARSATRLTGSAATESAFKEKGPGRRMLHLATHGFFLGGQCASALDARSSGRPMGGDHLTPPPVVGENPLLLSGLALAGANHRISVGPDEDDGVLTSEEVAAMDLSGVDWVVLSACDTGIGEYEKGEGVFGLRRAFQLAGARTVITSLWSVEDEATRAWMRDLYRERLAGASTAQAVRDASRHMIERLRRSGLPAHPYYWAGFVAVGEWR